MFEWRTDAKANEKITVCVREFQKKKEDEWELSTTGNFKWCSVRSILKVVGAVDDGKWLIHVDFSQVVKQVPALKEMDKDREAREEILKKKERKLRKEGSADDMTEALLRAALDEMKVTYHKNEKKADLVGKVEEARSTAIDATQDCDSGSEHTPYSSRKTPKLKWASAYYHNEKNERLFYLLLHILFLLNTTGTFIDFSVCTYVNFVLSTISLVITRLGIAALFIILQQLMLLLLTVSLFAKVQLKNLLPEFFGSGYKDERVMMCGL